jgi:hypothetical protein
MTVLARVAVVLSLSSLVACGSSSSGGSDPGTSAAGAAGTGGTSGNAGASGNAGSGTGGSAGGTSGASCTIPVDANSCVSGGASPSCQAFWGAYTADIVMKACPAPNTFQPGPCSTAGAAAVCVYPGPASHSLNVPPGVDLKASCEAAGGAWCIP